MTDTLSSSFAIFDVLMIGLVVSLLAIARWAPGRDWTTIGVAVVCFAAADLTWALNGDEPTALGAVLWSVAPLILGLAPWQRSRPLPTGDAVMPGRVGLAWLLVIAAVGVIVAGNLVEIPPTALWLAAAAVVVASVRALQTARAIRSLPQTRREARTDELTGLTNRRGFLDAIERRLERHPGRPVAMLMLDLDRFKELNDTLGHAVGDRLLAELGPRLAAGLRPGDTIARLGGDEFAVLCPGASPSGARQVARRLHGALEAPFGVADLQVHVDVSIGFAVYPDDGASLQELLQRADVAMYQAKGGGTAIERYDPGRDEHSRDRLELASELRRALTGAGGIELHYQPQVALATGAVLGVEALVRWRHPVRGVLGPAAFLPVAEGAGLMRPLGREVLRTAVEQATAWRAAGHDVPIAVNLATADLVDSTLATEIAQLLDNAGLEGGRLKLEITESTVMAQPERAVATLQELRSLGCRVSLDDFGTGHASLEHLVRLPVDELKIDRSFVLGLDRGDERSAAVVRALARLGRDLGLSVVAEGVETDRAHAALADGGCDAAQGYLLSRPLPAADLEAWLRTRPVFPVEEHAV